MAILALPLRACDYKATGFTVSDQDKSKQELIEELTEMRRRVAVLEKADTDRKQSEEALKESEERFRKVFEAGPLGILLVGTDGRIQHTNPLFCEMLGYSESEIIALGLPGISHPDDWERDHPFVSRLWNGEISHYHAEKRYFRKDGRVVWAQLTVSLIHDDAGRPINTVGMVKDITERKRSEEELRESEEQFRLLVEAIPQPIWRSDADGNVIEFNRRWHEYTGQTAEEAKGSGWTKALHPDEAAMVVNKVRGGITSGAAIEIVNRLRRASDGSYRWHLARAVPMNDRGGKIIGWFGCATDIDDQKRAEEALRQSEEALQKAHEELEQRVEERTAELKKANEALGIFRKFAEDSGEGFGMSDFDGRIVYANPTLSRLFGEERPEDVIGKNVSAYYPAEYLQRRKEELVPALLREGHLHIEQTVLRRHGETIQTLQSTFLIRNEDGTPFRIAVVISDITERKQAEAALRASEERFRVTFEEAPVGMVIGVGDGIITKANRALCGMSGFSQEELVGRHVSDFTHLEDRELSSPFIKRLMAGEIPSFTLEKRYLRKDGGSFWAQATTAAAHDPDGKIAFALGVVEDITERKQAEEALQRQHQTLKHLLHSSDHERQLIAYDIHDGLAQHLAGAIMQFQAFDHLKSK